MLQPLQAGQQALQAGQQALQAEQQAGQLAHTALLHGANILA
jgi:hypothetical protein